MKRLRTVPFVIFAGLLMATAACAPKPDPAIDEATVIANHAAVRLKNSSTSRTLTTLEPKDKVEILERKDNWYRIRLADMQGWMEASTLVTTATTALIRELAETSKRQPVQNTATLRDDANLRIEPGRSTIVIRKLRSGTRVEVLDRKTLPRPGAENAFDAWIKARSSPETVADVGWVLGNLIDFDVPEGIAPYTEDHAYSAVQPLAEIQDPERGTVNWYIVGERLAGFEPAIDFNGIRVFTWSLRKHRYETAFRLRGLRGVYPLEVTRKGANPQFRVHELNADGTTRTSRDFAMSGVIVREVKSK